MNVCYLIGAGEISSLPTPDSTDLVIAADGGYDPLISHGVRCDVLIGDLDSIGAVPHGIETIRFPVMKDETDMHLSYLEGARRGFSSFVIYGGSGGRIDHTYANLSLLLYGAKRGHRITMEAPKYTAEVIYNREATINGHHGNTFSVFAFGSDANGVSISGAKYNVENVTLTPDFPLGVSNSFEEENVRISVHGGALLVIKER